MQLVHVFTIQNVLQILAVLILFQHLVGLQHLLPGNPSVQVSNLLQAGDLAMLVCLHRLHEIGGFHQGLMGSRIQPGKALAQERYLQLPILQVNAVQIRDLQLPAGRRL